MVDFIKWKIECRMHLNNRGGFQSEQHTCYPIQIISCMNVWFSFLSILVLCFILLSTSEQVIHVTDIKNIFQIKIRELFL